MTHCGRCGGAGLIRIAYHSGESSDVAICECAKGQLWAGLGESEIRRRYGLEPDQQVGHLDQFEETETKTPDDALSFIHAGRTKKAKL